jgi:hypothetical protein
VRGITREQHPPALEALGDQIPSGLPSALADDDDRNVGADGAPDARPDTRLADLLARRLCIMNSSTPLSVIMTIRVSGLIVRYIQARRAPSAS